MSSSYFLLFYSVVVEMMLSLMALVVVAGRVMPVILDFNVIIENTDGGGDHWEQPFLRSSSTPASQNLSCLLLITSPPFEMEWNNHLATLLSASSAPISATFLLTSARVILPSELASRSVMTASALPFLRKYLTISWGFWAVDPRERAAQVATRARNFISLLFVL